MKILSLVLLCAATAFAQTSELRVIRVTHQQFTLLFSAVAGENCNIEVSESPTYTPLLHDVNGTLFPGANVDLTRPDTHVSGTVRTVVIGKRIVATASDNKRYSLSLQAFTPHYVRTTGCTGSPRTTQVVTDNIPYGLLGNDALPADDRVGVEGYYGWPSENQGVMNESHVDHLTGLKLTRVTNVSKRYDPMLANANLGTPTGTWTNIANGLTVDGAVASTTDTSTGFYPVVYNNGSGRRSVFAMSVTITARITGGATGEDAKIRVGLCTANDLLSDWKEQALTGTLAAYTLGDANSSGAFPSLYWAKLGEYLVEGWGDNAGRGICVQKKTSNPAYALEVDGVTHNLSDAPVHGESTTAPNICAANTTTDSSASGKTFILCFSHDKANGSGRIYAINLTDRTSVYLTPANGVNFVYWDGTNPRRFWLPGQAPSGGTETVPRYCDVPDGVLSTMHTGTIQTNASWLLTNCKYVGSNSYSIRDQVIALNHPGFVGHWPTDTMTETWSLADVISGGYLLYYSRVVQESGGWVAIFDPNATPLPGCVTDTGGACLGRVIAVRAWGLGSYPQESKFAYQHSFPPVEETGIIALGVGRQDTLASPSTTRWRGPYAVKGQHPGGGPIQPADTAIELMPQTLPDTTTTYDYVDQGVSSATDDDSLPLEVGDVLFYRASEPDDDAVAGTETMEVIAKNTSVTPPQITVLRANQLGNSDVMQDSGFAVYSGFPTTAQTIPAGTLLYGKAKGTYSWDGKTTLMWNFLADPLGLTYVRPGSQIGAGSTKANPPAATAVQAALPFSSGYKSPNANVYINHGDHGIQAKQIKFQYGIRGCSQFYGSDVCFAVQTGKPGTAQQANEPVAYSVGLSARFANVAQGVSWTRDTHPRMLARLALGRDVDWAIDRRPIETLPTQSWSVAPGTTRVYVMSTTPNLNRRHRATKVFSGDQNMADMSGPGSLITDADVGKFCITLVGDGAGAGADECRPGATVGQVYANPRTVTHTTCTGLRHTTSSSTYPQTVYGICALDLAPSNFGVVQIDMARPDPVGLNSRALTMSMTRPMGQSLFSFGYTHPHGKSMMLLGEQHGASNWYLASLPPLPGNSAKSPLTFERVPVDLYHGTAASFILEFGYRENGAVNQYRCTTRLESCVVRTATVTEATPFEWASESNTRVSCANGRCKAELPVIPNRIVFSRALFYDGSGNPIETRVLPPQ